MRGNVVPSTGNGDTCRSFSCTSVYLFSVHSEEIWAGYTDIIFDMVSRISSGYFTTAIYPAVELHADNQRKSISNCQLPSQKTFHSMVFQDLYRVLLPDSWEKYDSSGERPIFYRFLVQFIRSSHHCKWAGLWLESNGTHMRSWSKRIVPIIMQF